MIVSTGNFLLKCFDTPSIETLNELLSLALKNFNIKYWAYLSLPNDTRYHSDNRSIYYTNYPQEWVEFYFENRFQTIDPILLSFQSTEEPYLWSCFLKELSLSTQQKKFFKQASDFQLHEGITALTHPFWGRAIKTNPLTFLRNDRQTPFFLDKSADEPPNAVRLPACGIHELI
jgi:hypothetical protein